jgi:hypothetical protein
MGRLYSIASMDEPKHEKYVTAIVVVTKVAKTWSTVQLIDTENGDIIRVRHEDLLYCEGQDDEGPSGEDLGPDEEGYVCQYNCGAEFRRRCVCERHEWFRHVKNLPYADQQAYKGSKAIHHVLCWKEAEAVAEEANKFIVEQQLEKEEERLVREEEEEEAKKAELRENNVYRRLHKKGEAEEEEDTADGEEEGAADGEEK